MEAFAESDPAKLREGLVQVAAVALSWIDSLARVVEAREHVCNPPKQIRPTADGMVRYDIYPQNARWTCYICKQVWRVTDRREVEDNVVEMTWSIYRPIIEVALPEWNVS
jgi:hypothetical protein